MWGLLVLFCSCVLIFIRFFSVMFVGWLLSLISLPFLFFHFFFLHFTFLISVFVSKILNSHFSGFFNSLAFHFSILVPFLLCTSASPEPFTPYFFLPPFPPPFSFPRLSFPTTHYTLFPPFYSLSSSTSSSLPFYPSLSLDSFLPFISLHSFPLPLPSPGYLSILSPRLPSTPSHPLHPFAYIPSLPLFSLLPLPLVALHLTPPHPSPFIPSLQPPFVSAPPTPPFTLYPLPSPFLCLHFPHSLPPPDPSFASLRAPTPALPDTPPLPPSVHSNYPTPYTLPSFPPLPPSLPSLHPHHPSLIIPSTFLLLHVLLPLRSTLYRS